MAHLYDNLLTAGSNIRFEGENVIEDEEMSPTVERLAVFLWLHFIDDRLPAYVSRVYAQDLKSFNKRFTTPDFYEYEIYTGRAECTRRN